MLMQIIQLKIFKNCALFTDCISETNNTSVGKCKDIDIVMPIYNLIKYSDIYSKTYGSLWQYCKEIPAVDDYGNSFDLIELPVHLVLTQKYRSRLIITEE